jgi:hypothetical protein
MVNAETYEQIPEDPPFALEKGGVFKID